MLRILLVLLLAILPSAACIWDCDTLLDETFALIAQFPYDALQWWLD